MDDKNHKIMWTMEFIFNMGSNYLLNNSNFDTNIVS